jgi:hypothetical protein
MDVVESLEVWKASRRLAADAGQMFGTRWLQFKLARRFHPLRSLRSGERFVIRLEAKTK